jgi:hypothetical protein
MELLNYILKIRLVFFLEVNGLFGGFLFIKISRGGEFWLNSVFDRFWVRFFVDSLLIRFKKIIASSFRKKQVSLVVCIYEKRRLSRGFSL